MSGARLEIERLRLLLAKARRERFGQSAERGARLVEQLELQLAELEETAAEEDAAAELAAPPARPEARARPGRRPARRPLPEHLPRERIVYPAPCSCPRCGGPVRKLGEDVTETLECEPRRWKVVEHVREKVSCRCCEAVSQPPAPSHPIARGRAGPGLLALVLAAKYGQHLPLTRQSAIYAREGVEIDVSTLADWVGASTAALVPMVLAVRAHVFAAARLHGDDTTVPVLAKGRTRTGYLWGYVRDDRPFGGPDPPAVAFFYSPDRKGEHPERHLASFAGILQADAYAGFDRLYDPKREPGPILEAACWAHARRKLFELAAVSQGADRGRGGAAHRRAVRDRARDQRQAGRGAPGGPGGAGGAAGRRARGVAARPARAGLAQVRGRQGDRLRAQPLEGAHPVPRGRADLPEQQRGRARAARRGRRAPELDLRRLRTAGNAMLLVPMARLIGCGSSPRTTLSSAGSFV